MVLRVWGYEEVALLSIVEPRLFLSPNNTCTTTARLLTAVLLVVQSSSYCSFLMFGDTTLTAYHQNLEARSITHFISNVSKAYRCMKAI